MNPFQAVKDFESALCDYTGAKYAVATTSCTMALLLALRYHVPTGKYLPNMNPAVNMPKKSYVSVPQSIINAGLKISFRDEEWSGQYELQPYNIWDSARLFTSGMYRSGFVCVSFHWSKTLAIGQGGAILHDNEEADEWFRRARFDGRTEGVAPADDHFDMIGYHAYMSPRDAADGLSRLAVLPKHNEPLQNDNYPDLSTFEVFK
jgi:dTDP-4-amino-4,6-dideoxygalactose transaminase